MNTKMVIQADISNPTPRQNPQITILFNAVPVQKPLVLADALAWREALDAVIGEATSVVEELKAKRRKGRKSKDSAQKVRPRTKRARQPPDPQLSHHARPDGQKRDKQVVTQGVKPRAG
jgi:hypothetical protein